VVRFHLAQVNVSRLLAPLDSERLRPFVEQLERVNAAADAAPGFVWRLQTDDGDATAVRVFDDAEMIVNLSVWESLEALQEFAYRDVRHVEVLRRRREFFTRDDEATLALWWIDAGTVPTVADAESRLTLLRAIGPSPDAFTFKRSFPPPGGDTVPVDDDRELCPAP
jgi:heme-degrading monooxygenase HmoA